MNVLENITIGIVLMFKILSKVNQHCFNVFGRNNHTTSRWFAMFSTTTTSQCFFVLMFQINIQTSNN
jgi:hypothetical protein